nr:uncharacterized protein K02A2.6-like [Lytechinus pictus]
MRNSNIRQRLLREAKLTLEQTVTIVRAAEAATAHASEISKSAATTSDVHYVNRHQPNRKPKGKPHQQSKSKVCRNCGDKYPHSDQCPAQGKTCSFCKKPNHFAKMCRSKLKQAEVNVMDQMSQQPSSQPQLAQDSTSEDYLFALGSSDESNQLLRVSVLINNVMTSVVIDTGASVNIMSKETFNTISQQELLLEPTDRQVYAFGANSPIDVLGKISLPVRHKTQTQTAVFFVTEHNGPTLLRLNTAKKLQMIAVTYNVHAAPSIIDEFSDRFSGLGKLTGVTCKLHVNPSVTPVTQSHRRIPFHVRRNVEAELKRIQDLDIIEPVHQEPTPWVSPIRVVPKPKQPGKIRLCVDMRAVNRAIERKRHVTPAIDDILAQLNGATVFTKLDLNAGYHQFELDQASRYLTVFSTHVGLYQYKRLNFGVNSGAEQFQNLIQSALAGLQGVINISDDILVYAKNEQEHNEQLMRCMRRLREKNLTLNRDKCEFNKSSVEFFGHIFSSSGISPSPTKCKSLIEAAPPSNREEVRSFLGSANYCARFIPNLASLSEPLRDLTRQSVP